MALKKEVEMFSCLALSFSFQWCSGRRDNISDSSQSTSVPAWSCPGLHLYLSEVLLLTVLHCSDRVAACFHLMSQLAEAQVFLIQTQNSPQRRLMSVVIDVHRNRNCT